MPDSFCVGVPLRFLFGNQATGLCSQGCQGIMDTGTFPLTIPRQYLDSFVKTTGAQQDQSGIVSNQKPRFLAQAASAQEPECNEFMRDRRKKW